MLLSSDLMVVSRVQGPAARVGADSALRHGAADRFCTELPDRSCDLDLATPRLDLAALVAQLKVGRRHGSRGSWRSDRTFTRSGWRRRAQRDATWS